MPEVKFEELVNIMSGKPEISPKISGGYKMCGFPFFVGVWAFSVFCISTK